MDEGSNPSPATSETGVGGSRSSLGPLSSGEGAEKWDQAGLAMPGPGDGVGVGLPVML